jgi:hypothetical protein
MPKLALEEQLETLTRTFVSSLVDAIRNASFADVAALAGAPAPRPTREPRASAPARPARTAAAVASADGHGRQTAARRAEVGERVMGALGSADGPLGVRALASELGVAPDVLAAPIRELRAAGKIRKHGEKRATTYSLA